jgi:predicted metal-dependent HD superfamily phosphohydrolase
MINNSIILKEYPNIVKDIENYYNEQHRYYHNWNHIVDGFSLFKENNSFTLDLTTELAWYFHDIIYLPFNFSKESSNEILSAQFIDFFLLSNYPEFYSKYKNEIKEAKKIIIGTQKHIGFDQRSAFLFDVDLSYLGMPYEIFLKYRENVRKEYSWITEEQFISGTLDFYDTLLKQESIFNTPYAKNLWEKQCRYNLLKNKQELQGIKNES